MRARAGLNLAYVCRAEDARGDAALGIVTFHDSPVAGLDDTGIPIAKVYTQVLPTDSPLYEVWSSPEPAHSGRQGRVHFRHTRQLLFGSIAIAEQDFADHESARAATASPLQRATAEAYQEICATLEAQGYPHLLRIWNYLPDINGDAQGTERYRQFNTARRHALRASGRAVAGSVPAASALGADSGSPLVIYFLAGQVAPVFVENPRQVSAYHYPQQYGPHSPAFSRAALLRQADQPTQFISGTASIVGHRSLHVGDTAAQTQETLTNIEALLSEANRLIDDAHFDLDGLAYKVYVRRPSDLPIIQAHLTSSLGTEAQIIYLRADICREDLLVEIEATGTCPRGSGA